MTISRKTIITCFFQTSLVLLSKNLCQDVSKRFLQLSLISTNRRTKYNTIHTHAQINKLFTYTLWKMLFNITWLWTYGWSVVSSIFFSKFFLHEVFLGDYLYHRSLFHQQHDIWYFNFQRHKLTAPNSTLTPIIVFS